MTDFDIQNSSRLLAISRDMLTEGKPVSFQARGLSMRPTICDADTVLVVPASIHSICLSDIAMAIDDGGRLLVHRVVWVRRRGAEPYALLRGDACSGTWETISAENLLGKVCEIERAARTIRLDSVSQKLRSLFFLVIAPFVIWIFPILSRIKNNRLFCR